MDGADALVILTEWNEFRSLDLGQMRARLRHPVVIDMRNIYNPADMTAAGFVYHSIGRPSTVGRERRRRGDPAKLQATNNSPALSVA
jgi:hypothetical protein